MYQYSQVSFSFKSREFDVIINLHREQKDVILVDCLNNFTPCYSFSVYKYKHVFIIAEENLLWRARNHADARLYEKAQNHPTPSCDRLQSIYA